MSAHEALATVVPASVRAMWPVIVVIMAVGGVALMHVAWRGLRLSGVPDVERKRLMTATEIRFWQVLESAVPEYRIFGQVAMGALRGPRAGLEGKARMSVRGRFAQKIVDFLAVDADGSVVAVIELDDRSHRADADAARDAKLARAGYRVNRFHVSRFASAETIRSKLVADLPSAAPAATRLRAV